jgi:hypothetical protein
MPLNARRFIRKMRGGAQAHLIEADDGHFYVVKFQNNPQHRRILVNEFLAGRLLAQLGIDAPESAIIELSPGFLEANPDVFLQTGSRRVAVEAGWHFGSRYPGDPDRVAVYDFIPDALLDQVANADQFRAIFVFDRWAANADGRQCVFFRAQLRDWLARPGIPPRKQGFVALMIDHGFIFNGPLWDYPESAIAGLYARRTVYRGGTIAGRFRALAVPRRQLSGGGHRSGPPSDASGMDWPRYGRSGKSAGKTARAPQANCGPDPRQP